MINLLKVFAAFSFIIVSYQSAGAQSSYSNTDVQAIQRAAAEQIQALSQQLHELKLKQAGISSQSALKAMGIQSPLALTLDCPGEPTQTCAQDCTARFADGSCGSYGTDYCGPDARCAPDCTTRYADGSCGSYAPDVCGPDASCSPDCTTRYADGSCGSYGPDVCD